MLYDDSTICAIATPPGNGAIAVIRLSGDRSIKICSSILSFADKRKKLSAMEANTIHHATIFVNERILDEVLVSIFKAPRSYTGEDIIEISCHGAHFIQQQILQLLVDNGARLAQPGEFTLRAFMNNKLDLSQAEAVADLIASNSEASHRVAINQMRGGFSSELSRLREQLLNFISLIELELDFSEEDVEFADRTQLKNIVTRIDSVISGMVKSFTLGNVIKNGVPVAIIGKTNVGKSTLLNALLHDERAIVSEIAGTTRDALEDVINMGGVNFRFIDTAGLRISSDVIESIGIEKALEKINLAYIILYVIDATENLGEIDRLSGKIKKRMKGKDKKLIILLNKIDALNDDQMSEIKDLSNFKNLSSYDKILYISAFYDENIDQLASLLLAMMKQKESAGQDVIITNTRHYEALKKASEALSRVNDGIDNKLSSDFLAMDIRETLHYIGEITGQVTTDEILGNIFSKFCIGK